MFVVTVRNAAINALVPGLAAELRDNKTKVNGVCVHFIIGDFKAKGPSALGMDPVATSKLAPLYTALTKTKETGKVYCLDHPDQVEDKCREIQGNESA